jgi:Cu-Zn family superoxide dismutase
MLQRVGSGLGLILLIGMLAVPARAGTVTLASASGSSVKGSVEVVTMGRGVHFTGTVTGLTPGKHGFHVHAVGDCSAPDAASAGAHFNPDNKNHGAPTAADHHAGDLGNIEADASGAAKIDMHVNGVTLGSEANSIMGKALIVHGGTDDLTSQPAGNAGARQACGVIK